MARERMVTRTIITTTVQVLCVDITTQQVETKSFTLGANVNADDKKILSKVQGLLDENVKAVAITSFEEKEELYGMSEETFIKLAKVLPPR